jgi:predicted esterase
LATIVDLPDPAARRLAADALARRPDVSLRQLQDAMVDFGVFGPEPEGPSSVFAHLWVGKATERTRLHLYVPKSYDARRPTPLLLIGHWTGGSGEQALPAWKNFAERTSTLLLAPTEAGPNGGWAFSVRERESTRSAVRYMRRRFNVDENRIYCTGVSRGGHLAWDLALRYPDLFAAIAPMIGGPRIKRVQGQNNLRYLENVVRLPIRDLQGAKDDPYLVANLRLAFKRLQELGATDAKLIEFPQLGHSYDMTAVDWVGFFKASMRDPVPKRVVRMTATRRESRAFWVDLVEPDPGKVRVVPQIPQTRRFHALDELGQREYVGRAIEKATARLEVEMLGPGDFVARSRYVKGFCLLLSDTMFAVGKRVKVKHNGRIRRLAVEPSKTVLCLEFVERFDRTFLPIAQVVVR